MRPAPFIRAGLPVVEAVCPRPGLYAMLDRGLRRRAVYVCAPAGYGKTTLVASYLHSRPLAALWYGLDRSDGDPGAFFHHLSRVAETARPGLGRSLPPFTPEYRGAAAVFSRRYFARLFAGLGGSAVVVLDDCHEVASDSPLCGIIGHAAAAVPEGCGMVFLSRGQPPASLARARANGEMAVIGRAALRLGDDEAREIVALRSGGRFGPAETGAICARADGWAAGLVLLCGTAAGKDSLPDPEDDVHAVLDGYFSAEVVAGMDRDDRDFLLRTAVAGDLSPRLAVALAGRDDAGAVLARLGAGNGFVQRYQGRETFYRYHHLFRDFLLREAAAAFGPAGIARLMKTAAGVYAADGDTETAAAMYIGAGAWPSLADLVEAAGMDMLAQGRDASMRRWLAAMPGGLVAARPWLRFFRGACEMARGRPAAARPFFEKAHLGFGRRGDRRGDRRGVLVSWSFVVETYLHELGDLRPLDDWIGVMDALAGTGPDAVSQVDDAAAVRMFAALAVRRRRHPCFRRWRQRAVEVLDNGRDVSLRMLAGFYLHSHAIWSGDYVRAEQIRDRIVGVAGDAASPLAAVTMKMADAWVWLAGDCDACAGIVAEGLEIAAETGVHVWDYMLMVQGAAACLSAGRLDDAGGFLARMAGVEENGRVVDRFYYHYERSWLLHLSGDLPRAVAHQERALELAGNGGLHYMRAQAALALAHLCHDSGDRAAARRHLAAGIRLARGLGSDSVLCLAMLLRAWTERDGPGRRALARAMAIGRRRGYVNFSWWHQEMMAQLCVMALEDGVETDYVRDLVRRRGLVPERIPVHLEAWPWPVRIYTLGRFEVFVDGVRLDFRGRGKSPKKPLELLMALVAMGGEGVGAETLTDILWPDADGDAARKNLEVTIARLRRLLGGRGTVLFRMGRVSLARDRCYIDCRAFDALTAAGAGDRALRLYRGDFLAGEDGFWLVAARERLRERFVRHLLTVCRGLEEQGRHSEAADLYLRGIDADDLVEELHQGLVRCRLAQGRHGMAVSAARRCLRVLAAAGLEPSSRIVTVAEDVDAGRGLTDT